MDKLLQNPFKLALIGIAVAIPLGLLILAAEVEVIAHVVKSVFAQ